MNQAFAASVARIQSSSLRAIAQTLRSSSQAGPSAYILSDWAQASDRIFAEQEKTRSFALQAGKEARLDGWIVDASTPWVARAVRLDALSMNALAEPQERLALAEELAQWKQEAGGQFIAEAARAAWLAAQWFDAWNNRDNDQVHAAKRMETFAHSWGAFAGGCMLAAQAYPGDASSLLAAAQTALEVAGLPVSENEWPAALSVGKASSGFGFERNQRATAAQLRAFFAASWVKTHAQTAQGAIALGLEPDRLPQALGVICARESGVESVEQWSKNGPSVATRNREDAARAAAALDEEIEEARKRQRSQAQKQKQAGGAMGGQAESRSGPPKAKIDELIELGLAQAEMNPSAVAEALRAAPSRKAERPAAKRKPG